MAEQSVLYTDEIKHEEENYFFDNYYMYSNFYI